MPKEIALSLTRNGVNHDFKAVKEYEFVRVDESVSWKTLTLMGCEPEKSDNDTENDIIEDEGGLDSLLRSPMVERRKKRPLAENIKSKFNPVNNDVMDTSKGWHNNYEKNKRKTISALRRLSVTPKQYKLRKSVPSISINKSENSPPNIDNTEEEQQQQIDDDDGTDDQELLNMLQVAINESRPLVNNEYNRLCATIVDWKHILKNESDIPPNAQGDIQSTVARTQILLDKRFKSTLDAIDKAEIFILNNGIMINDKEYKPDNIYGFVDLLISEIKDIDSQFQKLLKKRENDWIEKENELLNNKIDNIIKNKKKHQPINIEKKTIENRNGIKTIRGRSIEKGDDGDDRVAVVNSDSSPPSARRSLRETVRSKSVIKSTTGTPVHHDTPRPPSKKSESVDKRNFLVPTITSSLSNNNNKRSLDTSSHFTTSAKKARQSEI